MKSYTSSHVAVAGTRQAIAVHDLAVSYESEGDAVLALKDLSLGVGAGEFVSLVGPSGAGKSSLLRVIAGLQQPAAGSVMLAGEEVTGELGLVGYMPQKDLLMEWKSVLDNVAIALELQGVRRKVARSRALEHFGQFGLLGFEKRHPSTLSGGMRQRASLLRTYLTGRDVLLLDEPFGSLDAFTRSEMQVWLADMWQALGKTIFLVTHDVDEAVYLSDRIYVLTPRPGRVASVWTVDLPRPRHFSALMGSSRFNALRREILVALHSPEIAHAS